MTRRLLTIMAVALVLGLPASVPAGTDLGPAVPGGSSSRIDGAQPSPDIGGGDPYDDSQEYGLYPSDRERSAAGVEVLSEDEPFGTASMPDDALGAGALPELGDEGWDCGC